MTEPVEAGSFMAIPHGHNWQRIGEIRLRDAVVVLAECQAAGYAAVNALEPDWEAMTPPDKYLLLQLMHQAGSMAARRYEHEGLEAIYAPMPVS